MKVSLAQQIQEVERELGLRRQVYRKIENTKPSKRSEHEFLLGRMEAVLATLKFLEKHREAWLAFVVAQAKQPSEGVEQHETGGGEGAGADDGHRGVADPDT